MRSNAAARSAPSARTRLQVLPRAVTKAACVGSLACEAGPAGQASPRDRFVVSEYVQQVRAAPHRAFGTVISHKEEANLFWHYGTAAPPPAKPVSRGAGRTMLHKYHAPAVNHAG
jgi:hypothetical protein